MKIAVVGSGISGLGAAWLLDRKHDVHVFEKRSRLGGHTHTVVRDLDGLKLPLDTGFIVFNQKTYPLLTRLLNELSVETQTSEMSFSVSCLVLDIEYASHSLSGLFAKRSLLLSAAHLKMLVDVVRFGRRGRQILAGAGDPGVTIAEFLEDGQFSDDFGRFYLMTDASRESASLTYHLNRLQGLDADREYLVTLNPENEPVPGSVIRRMSYSHPIFTRQSVETQNELPRINGRNRTHFCGAYFGNGFHEDGLASAVAVADDLGVAF